MTSAGWVDAVGVAGSLLSLAGVVVTVVQIRKTRRAAEAATAAALQAQTAITRNVLLVDVTSCIAHLNEIKMLIRGRRFEAALLRVGDLSAALIQLRAVAHPEAKGLLNFRRALAQLAILRDLLEQRLHEEQTPVSPVQVNNALSELADALNNWIGSAKYLPPEDQQNA